MKRFLLFAYGITSPDGGWNDFKGDYETLEEAVIQGETYCKEIEIWCNVSYEVVDSFIMSVVAYEVY